MCNVHVYGIFGVFQTMLLFFFASVKPSSHEHWRKIMKGKYKIICQKSPKNKNNKKLQPLKFTHHQKGQCLYKKSQIRVTNLSTPCSLWMWSHRVATNYKKNSFSRGGGSQIWMMVTNFPWKFQNPSFKSRNIQYTLFLAFKFHCNS